MERIAKQVLGKEFVEAVYEIVRLIPPGRATSYGAIARAAGHPCHARAVGHIMGKCTGSVIPSHRVVNSQGVLSARAAFGSQDHMQELLETEGVAVRNNRIAEWRKVFWDPLKEL